MRCPFVFCRHARSLFRSCEDSTRTCPPRCSVETALLCRNPANHDCTVLEEVILGPVLQAACTHHLASCGYTTQMHWCAHRLSCHAFYMSLAWMIVWKQSEVSGHSRPCAWIQVVRHGSSILASLTNSSILLEGQLIEAPGMGNGTSECSDESRMEEYAAEFLLSPQQLYGIGQYGGAALRPSPVVVRLLLAWCCQACVQCCHQSSVGTNSSAGAPASMIRVSVFHVWALLRNSSRSSARRHVQASDAHCCTQLTFVTSDPGA